VLSNISLTRLCLTALLAALGTLASGRSQMVASPAPQSGDSTSNCEHATERAPDIPLYRQDSSEEDWSFLCDPSKRKDGLDAIKYVPLGPGSWYLSLGGELRGQYELYRDDLWGLIPNTPNGWYLNRVLGHADFHFGARFRVFAELGSGLEFGRKGGPKPFDENKLDFGQAFFEYTPWIFKDAESAPISIKVGRQELHYGTAL